MCVKGGTLCSNSSLVKQFNIYQYNDIKDDNWYHIY